MPPSWLSSRTVTSAESGGSECLAPPGGAGGVLAVPDEGPGRVLEEPQDACGPTAQHRKHEMRYDGSVARAAERDPEHHVADYDAPVRS